MKLQVSEQSIDITHLTCWYQPIYGLKDNLLLGYESLVRGKTQHNLDPIEIFRRAELSGHRTVLDQQLIIKAQQLFKDLKDYPLFLNIFPSTMLELGFLSWWDSYSGIVPSIVLELSEAEYISDWQPLKIIVKELKKRGIKIAVDDMGAGHSSLQNWIELEPDYIKMDRYYMEDVVNSTRKQMVLESFIKLVGDTTQIIIEGVENIEGLKIAKELGANYAQGYILGMPTPIKNTSEEKLVLLL